MITIAKSGLLTIIQDLGRYGYQKSGVIASGAMDSLAHRIANLLVGNEEKEATLEITLLGPDVHFQKDALISICGGDLAPSINGKPVRTWRPILVKKDSVLRFGPCKEGCRAYLAIAGGVAVPLIMGSKSTYLKARIGGYNGRALTSGDQLSINESGELSQEIIRSLTLLSNSDFIEAEWSASNEFLLTNKKERPIRALRGRQFHLFTKESQEKIFQAAFEITPQSDRMGYRLTGPSLSLESAEEMISEAVNFGTIQVPSDGNPIILLADRQTTGGYPKIAQVATVDLPLLAQAKPGEHLHFTEISHHEAQQLFLDQERTVQQLKNGIYLKFK
ncbi:MAG TPA: biotin-dependent carboxyltransferase family protein [Chondromyces sp.]|nr:biotin-dependent carboxyltransferase family protein [Chondromyces sp.]